MMPDFDQSGLPETKEWTPKQDAPVILLENVSKTYGRIHALTGITLALSGGVTGILGMNGAGKSTLFKILMGKIKPSSGQVRLFGTNPWKNPAPYARVGFVPEHEKMYDWMTAHDFISTFARLNGLTRDESKVEADRVLDFVGLFIEHAAHVVVADMAMEGPDPRVVGIKGNAASSSFRYVNGVALGAG